MVVASLATETSMIDVATKQVRENGYGPAHR